MRKYLPILKTRNAETLGMISLNQTIKGAILPLFELTRPRKNAKITDLGPLLTKTHKLLSDYGTEDLGLDITSHESLQDSEIINLYSSKDNFCNWVSFVESCRSNFSNRINPTFIVSHDEFSDDDEFVNIHRSQIDQLHHESTRFIYRFGKDAEEYIEDLNDFFPANGSNNPIIVFDGEFIPSEKRRSSYVSEFTKIIAKLYERDKNADVVLAASSFPKSPAKSDEMAGVIPIEEIAIYEECRERFPELLYGDHASLYPLPNEQAGGGGWIPRIDVPLEREIHFFRSKRNKSSEKNYAPAYIRAARRAIQDGAFEESRVLAGKNCWGIEQIELAASGYPRGISPSFWIAVRINIHVTIQARRHNGTFRTVG